MKRLVGLVTVAAAVAEASVETKDVCIKNLKRRSPEHNAEVHKKALLQADSDANVPGTGMDLTKLKPFERAFKNGYYKVACMNEGMRFEADKHSDQGKHRYSEAGKVSIVRYDQMVKKEDRKKMTPAVCFNFCRSLGDQFHFFGINNGRDCYCTPYYKPKAGGEDEVCDVACDGNPGLTCGGKNKSDVYEMHMCYDTAEDLKDASEAGLKAMGILLPRVENVGSCAASLQYIGGMTQIYGSQGGDLLAGSQGQIVKVKAGDLYKVARKGLKAYKRLEKAVNTCAAMVDNEFSPNKGEAAQDNVVKAEDALQEYGKALQAVREETDIATEAHKSCAGYRGFDMKDSIKKYYPVVDYLEGFKGQGNDTDSICNGRELIGTIEGKIGDCASRCDQTLHPKKCVGFQHYDIVEHEKKTSEPPSYRWCGWWARTHSKGSNGRNWKWGRSMPTCDFVKETDTIAAGEEEFKREPGMILPGDKDVKYAAGYMGLTFEGPATLDVEPLDAHQCWYLGWYHLGKWMNIRASKSKDEKRYWDCNWNSDEDDDKPTYYWYQERERGYWSGNYNVTLLTREQVKEKLWTFDEGFHWVWFGGWKGFQDNRPVAINIRQEVDGPAGVCSLYGDVENVSYYTCPEDHGASGQYAKCYMKVSESKGWKAKEVHENQRCMVTDPHEVPEFEPFDIDAESRKLLK
jgi:hypothetical protein